MSMEQGIGRIVLSQEEIAQGVDELASAIAKDYAGEEVLLIGVLKGSFIFLADLMRALTIDVEVDFLAVSSYGGGTSSSGTVRILKDLDKNIQDRHVLVVEDIVDSGLTINYLIRMLKERRPASLKLCSLLDKPASRKMPVEMDYIGFTVPAEFLVGYGLDYQEKYRQLPYIGILEDHSGR